MKQGKNIRNKASSTATPAIDWQLCVKLANNQVTVAQDILRLVIQHLPSDIAEIKKAKERADYAEMQRRIHKLHGSLCYSGMPRLRNAVEHLEGVLKEDPFDDARLQELSGCLESEAQAVLMCSAMLCKD